MRKDLLINMLEQSPNDSFLLFALAKEYEKEQEHNMALQRYEQLRNNDPDYVGLYYHLGKLLEALERPSDALEAYDAGMAVAKTVGDQHALSELAAARLELDNPE